ncbi:MAG: amino acid permease [Thermoplasmata archaeon]|nr:MAG: amino acid permease [Thermoplasmata archaeon]
MGEEKRRTSQAQYFAWKKKLRRRRKRRKLLLIYFLKRRKKVAVLKRTIIKVEKIRITPMEGLAILVGTQVGAGVLGLPYAASRVGLLPAIFVLFGIMLLMLFTALIVLDFSASMHGAQMSTVAENVLGKAGGWIMYASIALMSFGALLAYVAGMGSVFSQLFGIEKSLGAAIFWVIASIIIYAGVEASGKTELIMNYLMLALFIGVVVLLVPHAKLSNALYVDLSGILSMVGISIFALGCHTVIPDVYKAIGSYKKTKKVVIASFLIPAILYAIFMASFLLVFGKNAPQIATQGLQEIYGKTGVIIGNIIPLLAITTSYIGVGLAQQSNSKEFLKLKKPIAWSITTIPPLLVYFAGIKNFADVLAFAGDTGDMAAFIILPIVIWVVGKYKKKIKIK